MWSAGLVYAAVSLALWQLTNGLLVPELLANWMFEAMPVSVIAFGVGVLGPAAKPLAFLAACVGYFGAYTLFAIGWPRFGYLFGNAFLGSLMLWLVHLLVLFPLTGFGLFGYRLPQGTVSVALVLFASHWMYARTLQIAASRERQRTERMVSPYRRKFVLAGLALVVVTAAAWTYRVSVRLAGRVRGGSGQFPDVDGLSREITPTGEFYIVSKNSIDPVVPETGWSLEVRGLVERPQRLAYAELTRLPSMTMFATLACISNEVGGDWIGNAKWTGVPLKSVLEASGLRPGIRDVVFHGSDGYRDSIPLDRALHPLCLLALDMNDAPLTPAHGFPVRLIVPGIYGMKNVKWITAIELVDSDIRGFWQSRGWDDTATYQTQSRIDVASSGVIAGIAFSGDRGISKVEVALDSGPWISAELLPPVSPLSWTLWKVDADARGKSVTVRATDGTGAVQTREAAPPFPAGSSGWHTVQGRG